MSYLNKIVAGNSQNISLVLADDSGIGCYYYVYVKPSKINAFRQLGKGKADLAQYGDIIESGYGVPTQAVIDKMAKEYNFIVE